MSFLGLLILATVTTLLGRVVARVARLGWLDRGHPDVLPLQAALGTAALTLMCATASHLGFGQRQALGPLAGLVAALLLWALLLGPTQRAPRACRLSAWLPLLLALLCAAGIGLLPILWLHSFGPFNDTFYYSSVADWLVGQSVDHVAPRHPMLPALATVSGFQELGFRLGSSYLHALLVVLTGVKHSMLVFYAVSSWGFVLLAGCLYALGRRAFRLSPWLAAAAVCTLVAVPGGEVHAVQTGFQAQLYGLAALLALIGIATATLPRRRWTIGGALVLGLMLAWQASIYSELLPVAGVVALAWLVITARRLRRHGGQRVWIRTVAVALLCCTLAGNGELVRAADGLPLQLGVVVGFRIEATPMNWLGFFAGSTEYPTEIPAQKINPLRLIGGPIVPLLLCAFGLARRRARPLKLLALSAAGTLVAASLYFGFVAADPWSHEPPHTWSLWKLSEWMHPLLTLGMWVGLAAVVRGRWAPRVAAAAAVGLVLVGLPMQHRYAHMLSYWDLHRFTGSDRPLEELEQYSRDMAALAGQPLYVVTRPEFTEPGFMGLLGYFTIHSPAAGRWVGCSYIYQPWIGWMSPDKSDVVPPVPSLTLICHKPHFGIAGSQALACQVVAVPVTDVPVLCQVSNPNGLEQARNQRPFLWAGGPATTLVVFAPRDGRARLDFLSRPPPGGAPGARSVQVTRGAVSEIQTLDLGAPDDERQVSLSFPVSTGVQEIELLCVDPAHAAEPAADARCFGVFEPRLRYE